MFSRERGVPFSLCTTELYRRATLPPVGIGSNVTRLLGLEPFCTASGAASSQAGIQLNGKLRAVIAREAFRAVVARKFPHKKGSKETVICVCVGARWDWVPFNLVGTEGNNFTLKAPTTHQ